MRSLRGTLGAKTREVIFATFRTKNLPIINTNASSEDIAAWKKKKEVANSYNKLFKPLNNDKGSQVTLSHIIKKVFENKDCSNPKVCTYLYIFIFIFNEIYKN